LDKENEDLLQEIELLKKENEKLKQEIELNYGDYTWATLLDQSEIDYVVKSKITKEMVNYLHSTDMTPIMVIETVIDYVYKNIEPDYMPESLSSILSLGMRTTEVLTESIFYFLNLAIKTYGDNNDSDFYTVVNGDY